jgi:hypothetical protein
MRGHQELLASSDATIRQLQLVLEQGVDSHNKIEKLGTWSVKRK